MLEVIVDGFPSGSKVATFETNALPDELPIIWAVTFAVASDDEMFVSGHSDVVKVSEQLAPRLATGVVTVSTPRELVTETCS